MYRILPFLAVVFVVGCSHTDSKTASTNPMQPRKSSLERRMDEQWSLYREAVGATPGQKASAKSRAASIDRALNKDFQYKNFSSKNYDKRYYDARSLNDLKLFPTKEANVSRSHYQEKNYSTTTPKQKSFETKSYETPLLAEYTSRRSENKKFGLRDNTDLQSKRVTGEASSATSFTRQQLGTPTKSTEVIDPAPGFKNPGVSQQK